MGRRTVSILVLILGLSSAATLRADSEARAVRFQHLGVEEGLSNSRIHALLRDSRGFLWVGTEDGLNRYDGSSMVVHRARLDDAHSLASSSVRALFEDDRKRLWVGAGGTLHLYDRGADRFERFPLEDKTGGSAGLAISAIRSDALGRVWVGTQKGLFRTDPATAASIRFRHLPADAASLSHDTVACLLLGRHQQLWIGTRRGLNRYDEATGQFTRLFRGADSPAWLRTVNVEKMLEDEHGVLWLATVGDGLVSYVPETGAIQQYLPEAGGEVGIGGRRILSLATDGKGRLYLGPEDGGLDVLDTARGLVVHHRPDPDDPSSLSSTSVTQLQFDDQGILWVGTFNGGVDYVSPFGRRFGLVTPRQGRLGNPHVLAFLEDHRGDLWIGTDGGGLERWDRKTGRFTSYRHDPHRASSLAGDAVMALHEDAAHDIWVGTWAAGLDRLDPRTGRFEHHRNPRAITDSVWTISADGGGNLLLGTFDRGTQLFRPKTGEFRPLAESYPLLTTSDQVLAVAVDAKGNFWLAEPAGPVYVDRGAGTAARHPLPLGVPQAILLDSRGNVWIGTDSGGLYGLPSEGQLRRYTVRDGLPSDNVASVLEDESGNLWVGTTLGLARISSATSLPARPQVLQFDVRDGLQGNEFKRGAALRTRTGEMFFGGQRGFNYFFPRTVETNPRVPPVVLTGFQLFNQPVPVGKPGSPLGTTITETPALTLSHRDSVMTFEFAALDFVIPSKHQYKYKLEGFDAAWNEVGSRRTATYTNLPPGDYTLRVAGSNNDGVWNEDGVRLPIRVVPPFWRTWTFQSTLVLGLLGAALGAHRWRVRQHVLAERVLSGRVQEALAEIKTLSGLLPICAWCKRIRADDGRWRQIEAYVRDHTQADFTHGVCPDCAEAARSGRFSSTS
jgi:ligand-binding sensor domain-containing protein